MQSVLQPVRKMSRLHSPAGTGLSTHTHSHTLWQNTMCYGIIIRGPNLRKMQCNRALTHTRLCLENSFHTASSNIMAGSLKTCPAPCPTAPTPIPSTLLAESQRMKMPKTFHVQHAGRNKKRWQRNENGKLHLLPAHVHSLSLSLSLCVCAAEEPNK